MSATTFAGETTLNRAQSGPAECKPIRFEALRPPFSEPVARLEARRCLECGGPHAQAPCITACPTGIDVSSFVASIARGKPDEAAQTIYRENMLGTSCAQVCPVEVLCEGACVLHAEGRRPVEIGRLQRFAGERALEGDVPLFSAPAAASGKRVAVIGAGPAGLACAAEAAMLGHEVTVYDSNDDYGGLLRYAIAPYRIGREPIPAEVERIRELGVRFRLGEEVDSAERLAEIERESDAVFLAIGLGEDTEMELPGEDLRGVWRSLEFIRQLKTGAPPAVGDSVAVIGGGNTAIDVAIEAKLLGASTVTMYYRRTEEQMPAYRHEIAEARRHGVHFHFLAAPVAFAGDGRVRSMTLRAMKLTGSDSSGRPRPEPVEGTEVDVPVDTVIVAVGQSKRTGFLSRIDRLELERGRPKLDPRTRQTTNPRYFAGGDAVNGGDTVVTAIQHGKLAARGIDEYVRGRTS